MRTGKVQLKASPPLTIRIATAKERRGTGIIPACIRSRYVLVQLKRQLRAVLNCAFKAQFFEILEVNVLAKSLSPRAPGMPAGSSSRCAPSHAKARKPRSRSLLEKADAFRFLRGHARSGRICPARSPAVLARGAAQRERVSGAAGFGNHVHEIAGDDERIGMGQHAEIRVVAAAIGNERGASGQRFAEDGEIFFALRRDPVIRSPYPCPARALSWLARP